MTLQGTGQPIALPYVLVLNIALRERDGRFWADPLWHKDLLLHLVAIARLTLACPVEPGAIPADWLPIDDPRITVVALPPMRRSSILAVPTIAQRLRTVIGPNAVVHTGVAGWPFPLGWVAVRVARERGAFLLINVESSFWRITPGAKAGLAARIRAALFERINRACLAACDLTFFTTEDYRAGLLPRPHGPSHVMPATWVDPDQLISHETLAALEAKRAGHLLFAGRLTQSKGVAVLLQAIERTRARIDLIGTGDLIDDVRQVAARFPDRVRLLDPVPYGAEFSALLDRYSAIVVPTLSDEQPRILLDAFSRGLAAIASDTSGNRQLVTEGVHGWLVAPADPAALAAALDRAAQDPAAIAALGRKARATMDGLTHEAMHRKRGQHITAALVAQNRLA